MIFVVVFFFRVLQVVVMNAALGAAVGGVGVAPRQSKSECKSSVPAARTVPIVKRLLSFKSMSAAFSPALAVEGASQMRNAVANHDLVTPVVSLAARLEFGFEKF